MSNKIITEVLNELKTSFENKYFRKYHLINEETNKPFQKGEKKLGVINAARDVIYVKKSRNSEIDFIIVFDLDGRTFIDGFRVSMFDIKDKINSDTPVLNNNKMEYESSIKRAIDCMDDNYCAPVALSVACNISYELANRMMMKHGRKFKKGTAFSTITAAFNEFGKKLVKIELEQKFTMSTAHKNVPSNETYLCFVNGHVACVKDRVVQDWTSGRRHKVKFLYKVVNK